MPVPKLTQNQTESTDLTVHRIFSKRIIIQFHDVILNFLFYSIEVTFQFISFY